jgi:hypothetical protein
MNIFFENWDEVELFLLRLPFMCCPICGASGSMGKHGYIYGYVNDRGMYDIRAKRIRCRPHMGGCGYSPSLRPGDRLFRYCFNARQGWSFLRELLRGRSIKAA